jgi:hypothetical protein
MPTIASPAKLTEVDPATDATRNHVARIERYRLLVDRQGTASFPAFAAAVKAGIAIKKAHPVVQVVIHDGRESWTNDIG